MRGWWEGRGWGEMCWTVGWAIGGFGRWWWVVGRFWEGGAVERGVLVRLSVRRIQ